MRSRQDQEHTLKIGQPLPTRLTIATTFPLCPLNQWFYILKTFNSPGKIDTFSCFPDFSTYFSQNAGFGKTYIFPRICQEGVPLGKTNLEDGRRTNNQSSKMIMRSKAALQPWVAGQWLERERTSVLFKLFYFGVSLL